MVKLTKEEKQKLKELKKLEKLRKEVEMKKQLKRDELRREMAAQALTRRDIDKRYKEMMLQIKMPMFRQDVEIMWHTFERTIDRKDHLINHLMKLIDVAEDQYQRTIASFCDTIDRTINKFLSDLEEMARDYERRANDSLKRGEEIANKLISDHNAAELHLQLLIFHGHKSFDDYSWNTRGEHIVKQEDEKSKYLDIRERLRSLLENNYNAMWDEYKATLKAYVVGTADNQKQVRRLRRKENLMADIIASQAKKMASNDETLRRLREELAAYQSGTKQAAFRDRRDRHRAACLLLKQRMYEGVQTDKARLALLVRSSDNALDWLNSASNKGEKILRFAALCRQLETQREKVMPFGSQPPHSPADVKSDGRQKQQEDPLVSNAIATTSGLTRLWQRISKAELTKRALVREKMLLERDNAELIRTLRKYEDNYKSFDVPEPQKCLCNEPEQKKKSVYHPIAIDGPLDLAKYKIGRPKKSLA